MQKQVLIALAVVGTLTAGFFLLRSKPTTETNALKDVYNQYKVTYGINVGAAEDDYRFKVFSSNYEKINKHNTLLGRTYNMAVNPFTHITQEEFSATHLGLKIKSGSRNSSAKTVGRADAADWTEKMNPVKNQGQCGSCWAFSAVGALEGLHSVKGKALVDISEQELVDCSTSYGNEGCNGGLMDLAFKYVIDAKGLLSQKDYPYRGSDGKCKNATTPNKLNPITGFADVKENSTEALMAALSEQPVAVAIEADTFTFQFYTSGVITGKSCGTELDHGVVAVGFNSTAKPAYYKVRNSWGKTWGDKGHVKIGIEEGPGVCGIQMAASYPTI